MADPVVVWRFTDGKPGHENQSAGLLAALGRRVVIESHDLPATSGVAAFGFLVTGRFPPGYDLPDPDLLLGAGHATHLSLLAAKRARGGRTVVLMQPSLPCAWFDLCVIPAHDRPRRAPNVLVTQGVLNRMQPAGERDSAAGLILVGGPSAHVDWSDTTILTQLQRLLEQDDGVSWTLTTSRRTPESFLQLLADLPRERLVVVPVADTGPDWLLARLAAAGRAWVTADSVSMVYEALTAGAAVGLLEVPYHDRHDRLAQGMEELVRRGLVTTYSDWRQGKALQPAAAPFDEAARCADWICEQWLNGR